MAQRKLLSSIRRASGFLRRGDRSARAFAAGRPLSRARASDSAHGLRGDDIRFAVPERLPELPNVTREGGELESLALKQRLDVQGAMQAGNPRFLPRPYAGNRLS